MAKKIIQEYGINYEETFTFVACLTTMCSFLFTVAVIHQWSIFQMDVKKMSSLMVIFQRKYICSLFLVLNILLGRYVASSILFVASNKPFVPSLRNFTPLKAALVFFSSAYEFALFTHRSKKGTTLLFYVDDMIITYDDS